MSALSVEDLKVSYGDIHAVKGISVRSPRKGEVFHSDRCQWSGENFHPPGDLGSSPPSDGRVSLWGTGVGWRRARQNRRLGHAAHVPEGRGIFGNLTVTENLRLGAWVRADRKGVARDMERVFGLLPRLRERRDQAAGTLSGGEQQMLAVARALMSNARTLLLDEPSMGLAPKLVKEIYKVIRDINETGVTILLVEQNANLALRSRRSRRGA